MRGWRSRSGASPAFSVLCVGRCTMRASRVLALGVVLGGVLAVGVVLPAGAAQAVLTPPVAPLPAALSSELADSLDSAISGYSADGIAAMEAELAGSSAVPVFAAGALGVGAEVLAAAAGGFTFGAQGVGVYYAATGETGVLQNGLCSNGFSLLAPLYGTGCASIQNAIAEDARNADVGAGTWAAAALEGVTLTVVGDGYYVGPSTVAACFNVAGSPGSGVYVQGSWSDGRVDSRPVGVHISACPSGTGAYLYGNSGTTLASFYLGDSATSAVSATVAPRSVAGDPQRSMVSTIVGSDSHAYSCASALFTEAGDAVPAPCAPTLPPGVTPRSETITEHTPGGSAPDKVLSSRSATPAYQAAATAYPDCATGSCLMQVYVGGVPCTVGAAECIDWQADPSTDQVKCEYGPAGTPVEYAPPMSECAVLANYYDPASQAEGSAYADPATGAATSAGTSPSGDQSQMNQPGAQVNPDGSNQPCFPSGWAAFNPLNWVLQPVQCALRWAFVPRQSVIDAANNGIRAKFAVSTIGSLTTALGGFASLPAYSGGCGIPYQFGPIYGLTASGVLMNSCSGALKQPASVVHSVLDAVIVTMGFLACLRYVAGIFGFMGYGRGGPSGGITVEAGPAVDPHAGWDEGGLAGNGPGFTAKRYL